MASKAAVERTRIDPPPRDADAVLKSGFDLLDDGFGIFDRDLTLLSCNEPFRLLGGFPDDLCRPGTPLEALLRHAAARGDYGPGDIEERVAARLRRISRSELRRFERDTPDGGTLLSRYDPIPDGGLLVSCRDATDTRRAESAFARAKRAMRSPSRRSGKASTTGTSPTTSLPVRRASTGLWGSKRDNSAPARTGSPASIPTTGRDSSTRSPGTSRV